MECVSEPASYFTALMHHACSHSPVSWVQENGLQTMDKAEVCVRFVCGWLVSILKFCPMDRQTHVSSSPVNPGPVGTAPVQSAKGAVGFKGPVLFAFGFGFWCYCPNLPTYLTTICTQTPGEVLKAVKDEADARAAHLPVKKPVCVIPLFS